MNKRVLFLINGFGISDKYSYPIYSSELMPTMDSLSNNYLFSSIESQTNDYRTGYQMFSTGVLKPLSYDYIQQLISDNQFESHPKIQEYISSLIDGTTLNIFVILKEERTYYQLKRLVEEIKSKKNLKIFIHLILRYNNLSDYSTVEHILSRFNYELEQTNIGIIAGYDEFVNQSMSREFLKLFLLGRGEQWKEFDRKLSFLKSREVVPSRIIPFVVNYGFNLNDNDNILFYNYENDDISSFIDVITDNIKKKFVISSMFTINNNNKVKSIFGTVVSDSSLVSDLEKTGSKALIFTSKEQINSINYYCNGLKLVKSMYIDYMFLDDDTVLDKNKLEQYLIDLRYNVIIFNHRIDDCNNLEDMKKRLSLIDGYLKEVYDICFKHDFSLFISSLYGISKEIPDASGKDCLIQMQKKLPFILIDKNFNREKYKVKFGNVYNLEKTLCYYENNRDSLICKKNFIDKLLKK